MGQTTIRSWKLGWLCIVFAATTDPGLAAPNVTAGVQIGVGACVTTATPGGRGLADAAVGAIVSKGLNLLGNALAEAGKDKTSKAIGARNLAGGDIPLPACIQVVRGRFRTDAATGNEPWLEGVRSGATPRLNANGIWLADKPDFFFEGAVVASGDRTALTVRPLMAALNKPQDAGTYRGNERSTVLFLTFTRPGTSPNVESNPSATLVLGSLAPGDVLQYPAAPEVGQSSPYEAAWFSMSEADARKPLTVTALISETAPGSPFLTFLGTILNDDAVRKAATDTAKLVLVPGAAVEAEAAQAKEMASAADKADSTLADAISKLAACFTAGADLGKAAAAKSALRAYLAAVPAARAKIDAKAVDTIDLSAPDTVKQRCSDVHERLTGKPL